MIRVHIDRLVVDDPMADTATLAGAVQRELVRLLALREPAITSGLAVPGVRGPDIARPSREAGVLGAQIAAAVHGSLLGLGLAGGETKGHPDGTSPTAPPTADPAGERGAPR